ncbi:MAG: AbrB/MazE/SpoVT family DNA-binding domain-containing protein [Anaerolineales bacterium]
MSGVYQIRVGQQGVITLPKELRDQKDIKEGDILTLLTLSDDVFVLSRGCPRVDKIADQLADEWRGSGESLESMLSTLRDIRSEEGESES